MEVTAKKRGFFGGVYYRAGDTRKFTVTKDEFSSSWMQKAVAKVKEKPEKSAPANGCEVEHEPLEIPTLMDKYDE